PRPGPVDSWPSAPASRCPTPATGPRVVTARTREPVPMGDVRRVGILVGRERSFPDVLIAAVAARDAGVEASYAKVDITRADAPPAYDVLVDRISHEVPCY